MGVRSRRLHEVKQELLEKALEEVLAEGDTAAPTEIAAADEPRSSEEAEERKLQALLLAEIQRGRRVRYHSSVLLRSPPPSSPQPSPPLGG